MSATPNSQRGKLDRNHQANLPTKSIWLYPLRKDFRCSLLDSAQLEFPCNPTLEINNAYGIYNSRVFSPEKRP